MAWTTPASYSVSEVLAASKLNTHVRDNLRYLKGLDGQTVFESGIKVQANPATLYLRDTGGGTDSKSWQWVADADVMALQPRDDAETSGGGLAITFLRSGLTNTGINAGSPVFLQSGSAGAPALAFISAGGEGLYSPGSSTLGFATGFAERLTIAAGSAVLSTHWHPKTTATYNLGSTSLRWNECWVTAGAFNTSDVEAKEGFCAVDPRDALRACLATPIYEFAYKTSDRRTVSFIAQEADPLFSWEGLTAEAQRTASVAVAAIQELTRRVAELEADREPKKEAA